MKAVSITALTLVAYFLFTSLFHVEEPSQSLPLKPEVVETAVLGESVEKNNAVADFQPTVVVTPLPLPQELPTEVQVVPQATLEDAGVPVSAANMSATAELDISIAVEPTATAFATAMPLEVTVLEDQELAAFTASVTNGQAGQVVGVYVPGILALPVLQQPQGEASYVSVDENVVTQFSTPSSYGVIGLLAHNYLSGERFFELVESQDVTIIYGDGYQEMYQISKVQPFQALSPTSVYSNFVDLSDPSQTVITVGDLFGRIYTTPDTVVFQTCIEAEGDASWGRLFVTAGRVPNQ